MRRRDNGRRVNRRLTFFPVHPNELLPTAVPGEALELDNIKIWNGVTKGGGMYEAGTFGKMQQNKGANGITAKWVYT